MSPLGVVRSGVRGKSEEGPIPVASFTPADATAVSSDRQWEIALAWIVVIGVAAALVSARTMPVFLLVLLAAALVGALRAGSLETVRPRWNAMTVSLAAFLVFAACSGLWAFDPWLTLDKVGQMGLVALGTLCLAEYLGQQGRSTSLRCAEALWIGLVVGLAYLLIEILTDRSLQIHLYNFLGLRPEMLQPARYFSWEDGAIVGIDRLILQRNIAPITLAVWPAILAALSSVSPRWNKGLAAAILLLATVVVMLAPHGTSKIALVLGLLGFAAMRYWPILTVRSIGALWIVACLGVVPASFLAHKLDLHNAPWLPMSAQHRIIIWNHTAEQTLKAPILGVGASTTQVLGPLMQSTTQSEPGERWERKLSRHAHSVYLQTWFELGLVGIGLLTLAGLAILRRIGELETDVRPFAAATFVCGATVAAMSYGMWQIWFVALYGVATVLLALACRAHELAKPGAKGRS